MRNKLTVVFFILICFLISGCKIEGQVTYNEEPVSGITVTLENSDGFQQQTTTDENGEYIFSGVSNGRYTLTAIEGCSYYESEPISFYKYSYNVKNKDFELVVNDELKTWTGSYTISSQADIDELSGYILVAGNLTIGGSTSNPATFDNLDGLECLNEVTGNLTIQNNAALVNVDGLRNLGIIGGHVTIMGNALLENTGGLENAQIGGDIVIYNNASLDGLELFENMEGVNGTLSISYNQSLFELTWLDALTYVNGHFDISDNHELCQFMATEIKDLIGEENISGTIIITGNKICQ